MAGKTRSSTRLANVLALVTAVVLTICIPLRARAVDGVTGEFEGQSSWVQPTKTAIVERFTKWMADHNIVEEAATQMLAQVNGAEDTPDALLEAICAAFASHHPEAQPLVDYCRQPQGSPSLVDTEWMASSELDPWVIANLRLLYGKSLSQNRFYDESLVQFQDLKVDDVVDPASLLFYKSVGLHQLLEKEACLSTVTRLLEQKDNLPRRYASVAELMYSDLKPLKTDSLDEISRMMNNVGRRLGFGRAGKRVRTEEEEILAKLDKMIEELEKQQQQQSGGGGGGSSSAPSSPMQDSSPAGGRGSGDVANRDLGTGSPWGDLPPRERQETLQDVTKDLPAHYRQVLEEYFRKLARERNE